MSSSFANPPPPPFPPVVVGCNKKKMHQAWRSRSIDCLAESCQRLWGVDASDNGVVTAKDVLGEATTDNESVVSTSMPVDSFLRILYERINDKRLTASEHWKACTELKRFIACVDQKKDKEDSGETACVSAGTATITVSCAPDGVKKHAATNAATTTQPEKWMLPRQLPSSVHLPFQPQLPAEDRQADTAAICHLTTKATTTKSAAISVVDRKQLHLGKQTTGANVNRQEIRTSNLVVSRRHSPPETKTKSAFSNAVTAKCAANVADPPYRVVGEPNKLAFTFTRRQRIASTHNTLLNAIRISALSVTAFHKGLDQRLRNDLEQEVALEYLNALAKQRTKLRNWPTQCMRETTSIAPTLPASTSILFLADSNPSAANFHKQEIRTQEARVNFMVPMFNEERLKQRTLQRLREWDPFWVSTEDKLLGIGMTTKITSCQPASNCIKTVAQHTLTLPSDVQTCFHAEKQQWGVALERNHVYKSGDYAILLVMLPVADASNYTEQKRAECHMWPKGMLLQINGVIVQNFKHRVQQRHNLKEWYGQSYPLDLVQFVRDPKKPLVIQICCWEQEEYVFAIRLCKYQATSDLLNGIQGRDCLQSCSSETIAQLSYENGRKKAQQFVRSRPTVINLEDEESNEDSDSKFLSFSLRCPFSKAYMETPVRGKKCQHFQCYDLESFVGCNSFVSGSRWRCGVCEEFVSLQTLEACQLTKELIKESKMMSCDRVKVLLNGNHKLTPDRINNSGNVNTASCFDTTATLVNFILNFVRQNI